MATEIKSESLDAALLNLQNNQNFIDSKNKLDALYTETGAKLGSQNRASPYITSKKVAEIDAVQSVSVAVMDDVLNTIKTKYNDSNVLDNLTEDSTFETVVDCCVALRDIIKALKDRYVDIDIVLNGIAETMNTNIPSVAPTPEEG